MEDFSTVFLFSDHVASVYIPLLLRLFLGVIILLGSMLTFVVVRKKRKIRFSIFVPPIIWGVLWLGFQIPILLKTHHTYQALVSVYEKDRYEIVEGEVQVLHEQPESGHDNGDLIEINGKTFEIDYFVATVGYKDTIAHGGLLREGVNARIYYYEDTILKVDIKN
jgi:hypothetical protein